MSKSTVNNAVALSVQRLKDLATHIVELCRDRKPALAALAAALLGTLAVLRAASSDYKQFLAYGPGGIPYNVGGWLVTNSLRLRGTNPTDTSKFAKSPDERTWLAADQPGERTGARPKIGPHPIPQRQLDQHTTVEIKKRFMEEFTSLAARNANLVELKPSEYENHTDALWLREDCATFEFTGTSIRREISHIHGTGDYSAHVVLSPADCKKVIDSGWGQLHGLAGVKFLRPLIGIMLPETYTLLYAPRNEQELETELGIVKASIGYMAGSRDVK